MVSGRGTYQTGSPNTNKGKMFLSKRSWEWKTWTPVTHVGMTDLGVCVGYRETFTDGTSIHTCHGCQRKIHSSVVFSKNCPKVDEHEKDNWCSQECLLTKPQDLAESTTRLNDLECATVFDTSVASTLSPLDGKTSLFTGLLTDKQDWKCPVALLVTCCGSKGTSRHDTPATWWCSTGGG